MKRRSKKQNTVIILLIVLLLLLAVGYAAFSDVLSISGTANAKGTFNLEFQNAEIVTAVGVNEEGTKAEISEDKNTLNVNVSDLAYPGAGVEFSVDIVNVGTIPAMVNAVTPTNITGSEHIKIEGLEAITTAHPTIEAGGKCNIHFTVEWPVTATDPLGENGESTSFNLEIEYTQGTGKEFEGSAKHEDEAIGNTTPVEPTGSKLAETITGNDYGKAINYSVAVKGEQVNNWKVFYNDGTNVYIILDDYLENRLLPTATGLQTKNKYSVYSNTDRDTLVTALTKTSNWSEFANGVSGATAAGSPTNEMFVNSWNGNPAVNEITLEKEKYYGDITAISDPTKLYLPNTEETENCNGYWLASLVEDSVVSLWYVYYSGSVNGSKSDNENLRNTPSSKITIRYYRNSRRNSRNIVIKIKGINLIYLYRKFIPFFIILVMVYKFM